MGTVRAKRALLIGSPVHGLRGTQNDLNVMTNILKNHGFKTESETYVKRLFRQDASRQKIIDAWEDLIHDTLQGDAVVIYYSGHGVCVDPDVANVTSKPSPKIQFIVPYDFDCTLQTWRGISDGELSLLLRKTTAKTTNVTYILDCCHSARLGRKLGDVIFEPKAFSLDKSLHTDLAKIQDKLRQDGRLAEDELHCNPYVVRISAAASDETAWEYHKDDHTYMGLLTRSLSKSISKPGDNRSWRDIMLEVAVLVEQDYPGGNQHPRSAGPDNRRPFSLVTNATGALLATLWDDGYTTVRGGRANGVQVGDVFTITPFGSHGQPGSEFLTGTVKQVNAFAAVISPTPKPSEFGCTKGSMAGHAILQRSLNCWPILLPQNFRSHPKIHQMLDKVLFLRPCAEKECPLLSLHSEPDQIVLLDSRGSQLAAERIVNENSLEGVFSKLFYHAKEYVQAQNILALRSGVDDEAFGDTIELELGLESTGEKTILARRSDLLPTAMIDRAPLSLRENDRLYISIKNTSENKIFVNALSIDAAGKTTLITKAWERGISLTPSRCHTLAVKTFPLRGIPMRWPDLIPREGNVEESLVFIITNEEVDLRDLDASLKGYFRRGVGDAAAKDSGVVPYDVEHVRYHLRPSPAS